MSVDTGPVQPSPLRLAAEQASAEVRKERRRLQMKLSEPELRHRLEAVLNITDPVIEFDDQGDARATIDNMVFTIPKWTRGDSPPTGLWLRLGPGDYEINSLASLGFAIEQDNSIAAAFGFDRPAKAKKRRPMVWWVARTFVLWSLMLLGLVTVAQYACHSVDARPDVTLAVCVVLGIVYGWFSGTLAYEGFKQEQQRREAE